jgi:hypothetical protein
MINIEKFQFLPGRKRAVSISQAHAFNAVNEIITAYVMTI